MEVMREDASQEGHDKSRSEIRHDPEHWKERYRKIHDSNHKPQEQRQQRIPIVPCIKPTPPSITWTEIFAAWMNCKDLKSNKRTRNTQRESFEDF